MRPGITTRRDYDAARLRGLARTTKSASQGRRLLALAEIYDGGSRTKAACVGGVGLQTIRDWVLRFNAHGPEGLADRQAPGLRDLARELPWARGALADEPDAVLEQEVGIPDLQDRVIRVCGIGEVRALYGRELRLPCIRDRRRD